MPIVFGGIRYDVGLDYMSYFNAYADVVNPLTTYRYNGTPDLEITFRIIAHISDFLTSGPVLLFLVYCAITVAAFYAALRLVRPKNVGYAMFLFYAIFFLNSFNIMRQGAAMSIGILAISNYVVGNKRKALLLILVAALFHVSALLLLVYIFVEYFMKRHYLIRRKIARFTRLFLKAFALSLIIIATGLSIAAVGDYVYNITGRIGTFDATVSSGVVFKYMLTVAVLFTAIYSWKNFNFTQKRLVLFLVLGMIVYSLGIIHNEAARIGMYVLVTTPILAALVYDYSATRHAKTRFFLKTGVTGLAILYIVAVHIGGGEGVKYEYQNIFEAEYNQKIREVRT